MLGLWGSAMIRFFDISWLFELTMYLQLSGKLNHLSTYTILLGLYFHVLVLVFSSCAANHLGQADEDPQVIFWLLGKSS